MQLIKFKPQNDMTQTTLEGNKLIAEFVGGKYCIRDKRSEQWGFRNLPNIPHWVSEQALDYHSSWDWLMPVVEKIHATPAVIFEYTISLIPFCRIMYCPKNQEHHYFKSQEINGITGIEAVYDCVCAFIQWYNNTTQSTKQ